MRNTYNYKFSAIALLCLCSSAAFAQEENMETLFDGGHLLAYLVAALLISVFVMIFTNRLYYYREKKETGESERLNAQLALVMDTSKKQVWTYDKQKNIFSIISYQDNSHTELAPIDFIQAYERDDLLELRQRITSLLQQESKTEELIVREALQKEEREEQRIYEINLSILRYDKRGKPNVILGIQTDITDSKTKTENTQKLLLRFHTVFNLSLVDMIFYDENGILTDINDKAMETFGITSREALMQRKVKFHDIPSYSQLEIDNLETLRLSSITDIDAVKHKHEHIPELTVGGKMYYEAMVSAIRDAHGQLLGIIAAGRDITDMVESNHHQKESIRLLEKTTDDIKEYIQNINYSLKVSDVQLMNYYPDTHELEIYSDLNRAQFRLPQVRACSLVRQDERRKAKGLIRRMDRRQAGAINATLRTIMRDEQGRDIYLTFNVMPIRNEAGEITHYFGMFRNETEMTYTEMKLREETEKAQETEKLKNTFLLNMSYEIRTPLNAVIGFAGLFNSEHNVEDEPVFAEEIRKNTGELLRLINDILFISRLDARMIEFKYEEEDFATLFDGWCYMGWSALPNTVKAVVENPYSRLLARIDSQNLGMVIEKVCTFMANSLKEGVIRAKYEYRHGELMITIEDNGQGIRKKDLPHMFERFVRNEFNEHYGTGLDLPIIQEIVQQMGGNIELQSEEGKGTTCYISVPCECKEMERN